MAPAAVARIERTDMLKRTIFCAVLLLAIIAVAAACGGDDEPDDAQSAEEPAASAAPAAPPEEDATGAGPSATPEPAPEDPPAEPAAEPDQPIADEEPEGPAPDPPSDTLIYGSSLRGAVASPEEPAQFRFEGTEGDLVRIRTDGLDGMDPVTTLLEPNRTLILANDDESVANRDSMIVATLVSSGLQVVRVQPFDPNSGGEFILSLEQLQDETVDDSAIITIGDVVEARLHSSTDVDTFEFAGEAGQRVRIRADGAVGVDTLMEIFDPDGAFLDVDDDSGHGLDAAFELELPSSGSYRVDVFGAPVGIRPPGDRVRDRHKIGPYTFSVALAEDPAIPTGDTATALSSLALTYLDAIQQGDTLTIFGLSGPEQVNQTGWQSAADVGRDLGRLQDVVTAGAAGEVAATQDGDTARVRVALAGPGAEPEQTLRFDAISVSGQWLVDFVQRS